MQGHVGVRVLQCLMGQLHPAHLSHKGIEGTHEKSEHVMFLFDIELSLMQLKVFLVFLE